MKKCHETFLATYDCPNDEKHRVKYISTFSELMQFLDDRSLSVILREVPGNGRNALLVLREHYLPKIISLYTD